jgi:hypothetical protein
VGPSTPKSWQPQGAVAAHEPRRALLDDAQAEVLSVGMAWESSTLSPTRYIPMRVSPSGSLRRPTWNGLAAREQALEVGDVVGRRAGIDGRLVGVGRRAVQRLASTRPRSSPWRATSSSRARSSHGARELEDLGLDVAARELGQAALGAVDREVHAHAVALGQHLVGVDRGGVEAPAQEGAQALEQRRVVAALGQGDDDRRGASVGVAAPRTRPCSACRPMSATTAPRRSSVGAAKSSSLGKDSKSEIAGLVVVRADDQVLAGQDPLQLAVQDGRLDAAGRRPWS